MQTSELEHESTISLCHYRLCPLQQWAEIALWECICLQYHCCCCQIQWSWWSDCSLHCLFRNCCSVAWWWSDCTFTFYASHSIPLACDPQCCHRKLKSMNLRADFDFEIHLLKIFHCTLKSSGCFAVLRFRFSIPSPVTCFHSTTKNLTSLHSVSVLQSQLPLYVSRGKQTPQFILTFHAETTHQIHVGEYFCRACRLLLGWYWVCCSLPLQYAHH